MKFGETAAGKLYFVQEFVRGATLSSRLSQGQLSLDESLSLAWQIGSGLAEFHSHGIAHGDINPSNIIVVPNGWAKIVDLGIPDAHARYTNWLKESERTIQSRDTKFDIFLYGTLLCEMLQEKDR